MAQGLLSRTYLVMNEWQKAIDMAKAARSGYSLMNTTEIATDGFNEINNKEWMWGMDVTTANDNIWVCIILFMDLHYWYRLRWQKWFII